MSLEIIPSLARTFRNDLSTVFLSLFEKKQKNKPTLFFESRLIRSYALLNPSKVLVIKLMFSKSSSSMDAPASMRLSSTSTSAS